MKKKIFTLVSIVFLAFACSQDSNDSTSADSFGDGQGGSLATFTLTAPFLLMSTLKPK